MAKRERKYVKCKRGKWCQAMKLQLNPDANSHGKGLTEVHLTNWKTGRVGIIGIAYKNSARDKGLMINVCPWCGESLDFLQVFRDENTETEAAHP